MTKSLCAAACAALFLFVQIISPLASFAQTARNLNLTSTSDSVTANHSGTINIGGTNQTITSGSSITPAESIALSQIIHTGTQSLILSSNGAASGGTFNLSYAAKNGASALVIPTGVTAILDAAKLQSVSVSGALTNSGLLQVISQNSQVNSASISANTITNQQGGVITSIIPTSGIAGYTPALTSVHLTLSAVQDIINYGTISSSGNLNLNAGGSITNALPAGTTGSTPLLQAANCVNLTVGSGTITNGGLITALNGNINVSASAPVDLLVNSVIPTISDGSVTSIIQGQMQAPNGDINIGATDYTGSNNIEVWGGDFSANQVNVNSGSGIGLVQADSITGTLNESAGSAQVYVQNGTLTVGNIQSTGNVTLVNTNGNIVLDQSLIFPGQNLSILAGGNVTSGASGIALDTSSSIGNGGNIAVSSGGYIAYVMPGENVNTATTSIRRQRIHLPL